MIMAVADVQGYETQFVTTANRQGTEHTRVDKIKNGRKRVRSDVNGIPVTLYTTVYYTYYYTMYIVGIVIFIITIMSS